MDNPSYEAAIEKSTAAIKAYLSRANAKSSIISDDEFLAAKAVYAEAVTEFDKAYSIAQGW